MVKFVFKRCIPRFLLLFACFFLIFFLIKRLYVFLVSKNLRIASQKRVYHFNLKSADALDARYFLSYVRWKRVVNVKLIKHLFVYAVYPPHSLNDARGVVGHVVVYYNA